MPNESISLLALAGVFLASALGGGVNAIAGGGTLLTFPALVAMGVPALTANATSTVALWPGALSSMWGYRGELRGARAWVVRLTLPSILGGAAGAALLLRTPADRFARIVPFLVLGATLLFLAQGPLMRRLRARGGGAGKPAALSEDGDPDVAPWLFVLAQFGIGVYGGYFGAGIGILMLAGLGMMGFTNIHRMNGLKNWGAVCMNVVAAMIFAFSGIVNWPVALAMAVGGLLGGYAGARVAQRVGQQRVRTAIICIGLASFLFLLFRPL
ncbi:sulfite exporter TauE/SafE family protein [Longimicrobium sp.]|uniref:sulfite exporter TauE/SafE family protein n=1 Tax=Longimicrobium sp. TaxID=2029185 RepID=UPI002E2F2BC6|nr:sulfite exporter TauE/SafE family protein [Longimicrobium sp.]HEX6041098.1 sulfite exporter TauE/SafE family protein [Longimicrobium sp.]